MSERAAKLTRREIRRAVGPDGLDAIQQQGIALYTHVLPTLQALTLADQREADIRRAEIDALRATLSTHLERTFWSRLRWLVWGA